MAEKMRLSAEESTSRQQLKAALFSGDRERVEALIRAAGADRAGAWREEILGELTGDVLAGRAPFSRLTAAAGAACAFPAENLPPAACLGSIRGNTSPTGRDYMRMLLRGRGVPFLDLGTDVPAEKFLSAVREQGVRFVICTVFSRLDFDRVRELEESAREQGLRDRFDLLISGAEMEREAGAPPLSDCGDHRAAAVAEWVVNRWRK